MPHITNPVRPSAERKTCIGVPLCGDSDGIQYAFGATPILTAELCEVGVSIDNGPPATPGRGFDLIDGDYTWTCYDPVPYGDGTGEITCNATQIGCWPYMEAFDYDDDGHHDVADLDHAQQVALGTISPLPGKLYDFNDSGDPDPTALDLDAYNKCLLLGIESICPDTYTDDADCDGVPVDSDCDDTDANITNTSENDADCDLVITADDCDDTDPAIGVATTQCQVFDTDTNACETITQCEACAAPLAEVCEDGFDNDCDGEVDEECNLCGNNVRDEAEGEECDDNTDPNCNTNTCECINDTLPGGDGECYEAVVCEGSMTKEIIDFFTGESAYICNAPTPISGQEYEYYIEYTDGSSTTITLAGDQITLADMSILSEDELASLSCQLTLTDTADVCEFQIEQNLSNQCGNLNEREYLVFNPQEYYGNLFDNGDADYFCTASTITADDTDAGSGLNFVETNTGWDVEWRCSQDGGFIDDCSLSIYIGEFVCQ